MMKLLTSLLLQLSVVLLSVARNTGILCRRPVDIAFAIDASGSVGRWGFDQEKDFVREVVRMFGISRSGAHASVIVYSSNARVEISLTRYYSYSGFYHGVGRLPYTRGETRIDLALRTAAEDVFVTEGGSRSTVPKILVVMTDGFQTRTRDSVPLDKAVLSLRALGVQVYAMGIGRFFKSEELRLIVEHSHDIFHANAFRRLIYQVRRIATKACTNALPPAFGIYPLNKDNQGRDISARRAPTATLKSVTVTFGPYGRPGGAFHLQGNPNSYIDFKNSAGGRLDTFTSLSIFLWVNPEGKSGPIVNYNRNGDGVGLWVSHNSVLEGHIYSRRGYYRRKISFKYFKPKTWYYVGLMYDNTDSYVSLWVNGRTVARKRISRVYLATHHPIRVGSIQGGRHHFKGRVTCLQFYGMALNPNQITTIKKRCAAKAQNDPCLSTPCKNGGSCIVDTKQKSGYRCRCRPGYRGQNCEVKPTRPTGRPTGTPSARRSTHSTPDTSRQVISTPSGGVSTAPTSPPRFTTPGIISDLPGFRIRVVEYINRLRRLHGAGPLILSSRITMDAQNWAITLASRGEPFIDPNTNYGTNVFTTVGSQAGLDMTSVVTWYSSVKYYDWAKRKPKILALPFIHLIWYSSNFVGVGLSRGPGAKYFVVAYFDPMPGNKEHLLKGNVLPYTDVFLLMQSVSCSRGYKENSGACYKYHVDKQTWEGALYQSARDNATLVSFHRASDETFLESLVPTGQTGYFWTGLNDRIIEGTYTWSDGSGVEYSNWRPNEPTGNNEDCIGAEVSRHGSMSDLDCNKPYPYVSRKPLEGLITYRVKLQLTTLPWSDEYLQSSSLSYMELKQKIETALLTIYKDDRTFVSGYFEDIKKTPLPSVTTKPPTTSPLTSPASQSTTVVSAATGGTARPTTRPTLSSAGTTKTTSKPTINSAPSKKRTIKTPTSTVSVILKFGPGVAPDPTLPIQNHLRKHFGRLPGPVKQKTLVESVKIIPPGLPPAVLGTCTSNCLETCVVTCNPFCCTSNMAASNLQYSAIRHAVIAQAVNKGLVNPQYPVEVQRTSSQPQQLTLPVTLSVACVAIPGRPCPPGTQVPQTVQGSYIMPQPAYALQPMRIQPQPRPAYFYPQYPVPNYVSQRPAEVQKVAIPAAPPCIPSLFKYCPPTKTPSAKPSSVINPPLHAIHVPSPPTPLPHVPFQPMLPCIPSVNNACPPALTPSMKPSTVIDAPLHIIHFPPISTPVPAPATGLQCIPGPYKYCPPPKVPIQKPVSVTDAPVHVLHLPTPAPPPALPLPPPTLVQMPMAPVPVFSQPFSVPIMCIPRPHYPCPPFVGARKSPKFSLTRAKLQAVAPRQLSSAYRFPPASRLYTQPKPGILHLLVQRPLQYFRPQYRFFKPPISSGVTQNPVARTKCIPTPTRGCPPVVNTYWNANQRKTPVPLTRPISLQGSIYIEPKLVLPVPRSPHTTFACVPSPLNPCTPIPPYLMRPVPYPLCIPSPTNPCPPTEEKPLTIPFPKGPLSKPINLTRPLQLEGSVYIKSRPPLPGRSTFSNHPAVPCIPTATKPCVQPLQKQQPPKTSTFVPATYPIPYLNCIPIFRPVQAASRPCVVPQPAPQAAPQSLVVQLPPIKIQYPQHSLKSVLPTLFFAPQPTSIPSNCPVSCPLLCHSYCPYYCCKPKGGNHNPIGLKNLASKKKTEPKIFKANHKKNT